MAARDYESAPATQTLGLDTIIHGLADDLVALRKGNIGVNDALARAALAKQIFNGARLYLQASKMLSDNATPVNLPPPGKAS
jgi:hypothetical protein